MGLVRDRYGWFSVVGHVEVCATTAQIWLPWLISFEFWTRKASVVGEYLRKPEAILAVTLTVITVERSAYFHFLPGNEIA